MILTSCQLHRNFIGAAWLRADVQDCAGVRARLSFAVDVFFILTDAGLIDADVAQALQLCSVFSWTPQTGGCDCSDS